MGRRLSEPRHAREEVGHGAGVAVAADAPQNSSALAQAVHLEAFFGNKSRSNAVAHRQARFHVVRADVVRVDWRGSGGRQDGTSKRRRARGLRQAWGNSCEGKRRRQQRRKYIMMHDCSGSSCSSHLFFEATRARLYLSPSKFETAEKSATSYLTSTGVFFFVKTRNAIASRNQPPMRTPLRPQPTSWHEVGGGRVVQKTSGGKVGG